MMRIKQLIARILYPEYEEQCDSIKKLSRMVEELNLQNAELQKQLEELKAPQVESSAPDRDNLLENAAWRILVERLCKQVKRIRKRVLDIRTNEDVAGRDPVPFIESLNSALREAMIASGAEPIDNEQEYDILLHEAVPHVASVPENAPIAETLESGVKVGDHVFIRALVELKK